MGRLVRKELDGIPLVGFSVAGEETVIAAPEHSVCFDVGRSPREIIPIDNVCLSHGHMDHAAGIAYYFSQRNFIGNAPGRVIVHRGLAQAIQSLMAVWADIEGHHSPGTVLGVEPLEDVPIRRGLLVRPFQTNHNAESLGFSLIETRTKLKPEYHGLSGPEIVALKKNGVAIENDLEIPRLTYTGDTALGRFLNHDFVRNSHAVLIECTFFDREHRERARAGRHLHVDDLPEVISAIPEGLISIIHVTRRTDLRVAKRALDKVVPKADRDRVGLFMERLPRRSGQPVQSTSETPQPVEQSRE